MSRDQIKVTTNGLKDIMSDLDELIAKTPENIKKATDAMQDVMVEALHSSWGHPGSYIDKSIGKSTEMGENGQDVVGTVGVYKLDSVDAAFGRTEHDMNAAQLAYWIEFGHSRMNFHNEDGTFASGGVKPRNKQIPDELLAKASPNPFMSRAMYSTMSAQDEAFKKKIEDLSNGK